MVSRPCGLASCMNKFFIKKVKELRLRIPAANCDPLKYLKEAMLSRRCEFKIKKLTLGEVKKLIRIPPPQVLTMLILKLLNLLQT